MMKKTVDLENFMKIMILLSLFLNILLVFSGHLLNIPLWTSFGDKETTIKFVSAFLFFISTLTLIKPKWSNFLTILIIITSLYTYSSWLINRAKPLFLPIFESTNVVNTLNEDIPSWMTLFAFMVFAAGIIFKNKIYFIFVLLQAVIAFFGHLMREPLLYYLVDGYSTGQSAITSILFFHLAGYKLIFKDHDQTNY